MKTVYYTLLTILLAVSTSFGQSNVGGGGSGGGGGVSATVSINQGTPGATNGISIIDPATNMPAAFDGSERLQVAGTLAASGNFTVISAIVAPTPQTWNTGTALNTRTTTNMTGYEGLYIQIDAGATLTAGAVTFEVNDGISAFWSPVQCKRTDSSTVESSYTLVSSTTQAWWCAASSNFFGVRLSNAITTSAGGGTTKVSVTPTTFPASLSSSGGASGGSNFGSAFPTAGSAIGGYDGTNMQSVRVFDGDTGGGTQYVIGTSIRLSSNGGSVEGGTASNPIRTDPTGTTPQPVTGSGTFNTNMTQIGTTNVVTGGVNGSLGVGGLAANGASIVGAPVMVAGASGTTVQRLAISPTTGGLLVDASPTQPTGQQASAGSSSVVQCSSCSDTVSQANAANLNATVTGSGTAGSPAAGTLSIQGISGMTAVKVDNSAVTQPVSGTVAITSTSAQTITAVQPTGSNLHMACDSGCSSSPAPTDNSAFTAGSTGMTPVGAFYHSTRDSMTDSRIGALAMNVNRALIIQIEDSSKNPINSTSNALNVAETQPIPAGTNVIGHVIIDTGSTTVVTGNVAVTKADGSDVTLGAKADAKSTATDTTAITAMQVLKEISFMEQTPASRAVTNVGTFATQSAITAASGSIASGSIASGAIASGAVASGAIASGAFASGSISDGADVTLGAKGDAKSTATDTTAITAMQVLKEISAMEQAPASRAVTNTGTFATQSAITAASGSIASGAIASGAVASGAIASGAFAAGSLNSAIPDPCLYSAKTPYPINISTATTTVVQAASSSNKFRVCSIFLFASAAENVALVEDATGSCASPDAGMMGGTTAATGVNLVANQGWTLGSGLSTVAQTASTNVNVCLITSSTAQLSGTIMGVLAP